MGIHRILLDGQNEIFTELFTNLSKTASKSYYLTVSLRKISYNSFISAVEEQNEQFVRELDNDLRKLVLSNELFIDMTATCREYTRKVFETQHRFSRDTIDYCKKFYVIVNELSTQTDYQHALYLLEALKIKEISFMVISFEEHVTTTSSNISKLIDLAFRDHEYETEIIFRDPVSSAPDRRTIISKYRRKVVKIYLSYNSCLKVLPERIKAASVAFAVSGPLRADQELSPSQQDLLLDLTIFVMSHYPATVLFVYDGPASYYDDDSRELQFTNSRLNASKSKLLLREFGGNEIFGNCVNIGVGKPY